MKTCTKCNTNKPHSDFRRRTKSPDGLTSWCRQCFADYDKARWHSGDNVRKEANKARTYAANKANIKEYLETHPCIDCGESDIIVLEFDHRDPATKRYNICDMLQWSWKAIMEEIDKCDVRCANDHRRRTAKQFGYLK